MKKFKFQRLINPKMSLSKWMVNLLVFLTYVTLAIGHVHQWQDKPDKNDEIELVSDDLVYLRGSFQVALRRLSFAQYKKINKEKFNNNMANLKNDYSLVENLQRGIWIKCICGYLGQFYLLLLLLSHSGMLQFISRIMFKKI